MDPIDGAMALIMVITTAGGMYSWHARQGAGHQVDPAQSGVAEDLP